ncbi:MAG: VTT domain-containing protein [Thaumarchaeota archaeon]|nr:VTT domain-containing protein [Nitrososphaerota archaeon]
MADPLTLFLTDLAIRYGYLGVFFASLAGSVVPFLPVPYLIVVILLSGSLDPVALGVAAGVGGALGKATSYFLGRSGYLVSGAGTQRNLEFLGRFIGRYGGLGVFIFAVTPLPDDIYLVPLGMVKFPFWRFMAINTLGKVILSTAVAYLGMAYFQLAGPYLGADALPATILIILLTLAVTILLARADWELAYRKYKGGGAKEVLRGTSQILRLRKRVEPEST